MVDPRMDEKPEEYDRRKAAPYDFEPQCEVNGCEQRASQTIRCLQCGSVRMMLCGAHAGHTQRSLTQSPIAMKCGDCKISGSSAALFEFRPLWAPVGGES